MNQQPRDELIAEVLIGDEAEKFMESDLGRCLVGMAFQEAEAARLVLETVSPYDDKAIRELQNRVWLGKAFPGFINELITKGRQALEVYRHEQEK